jgi:hypothetical protein
MWGGDSDDQATERLVVSLQRLLEGSLLPGASPLLSRTTNAHARHDTHDTHDTRHDTHDTRHATRHTGGWFRRDSSARRTASCVRRRCPRGGTARALPRRRSCAASRRSATAIAWASTAASGPALPPARSTCAAPTPKVRLTAGPGPHHFTLAHGARAPPHTYTPAAHAHAHDRTRCRR